MKKFVLLFSLSLISYTGFAQCDPQSNINENFDTWTEIAPCWTGIANGGMFLVDGDVTFYTFMTPNLSMYLVSPEIVAGSYNLTFDFGTVSMTGDEVTGITIQVGTVSSTENADSFMAISDAVATTVATQSFSIPVTISDEAKYFVIKVTGTAPHSAAFIDNLILSPDLSVNDINAVQISAYPNPVVNQLNIQSTEIVKEVKLYTMEGKLVQNEKVSTKNPTLFVSGLKSGVYIAEILTTKGSKTIKVVKK